MAGTKVNSRKQRKSVKSRRVKQRGGLPNFLEMFEGRKAGHEGASNPETGDSEPVTTPVNGAVTHADKTDTGDKTDTDTGSSWLSFGVQKDVKPETDGATHVKPVTDGETPVETTGEATGGVRKLLGFGGRRSRRASRRVRRRKVRRTARRVRRRSRRRSNRRK